MNYAFVSTGLLSAHVFLEICSAQNTWQRDSGSVGSVNFGWTHIRDSTCLLSCRDRNAGSVHPPCRNVTTSIRACRPQKALVSVCVLS